MIRPAAAALLLTVLLAALPAHAFPGGRGGHWGARQGGQQQHQPQPPQRQYEGGQQNQQPQRMSPDERRQLRRDLRDANRDLPPRRDYRR